MPTWIIFVAIAAVVITAGVLVGIMRKRDDADIAPDGPTIDEDMLVERLDALDVDLVREQTPPPDLLVPLLGRDETVLGATRAKVGEHKALVVVLEDRLVSVEATLGRMGAKARVIPIASVESVSQRTNMGGEVTIDADGESHVFTHIPLRKFERFVSTLRSVVERPDTADDGG